MFTPTTNLRLLSTPLESDYRNTLWFPNVAAQTNYFLGKTVKAYENFNYIKKDNTITVPEEIDNLYNCNYIMYQNANFGNKWFYAFIDGMAWASNGSTRLYVSTDAIQTWFFDITYYQSYVDRCHSDTDVAGDNIVPEEFTGYGAGGYYQVGTQDMTPNHVAIFSTSDDSGRPLSSKKINGIISGSGILFQDDISSSLSLFNTTLNVMVQNGLANAVSRIQQYPSGYTGIVEYAKHPTHIDCMNGTSITTYIPTNKKLLSGAFLTGYITLYGQEVNFNPEYVYGSNISIRIATDITTGTVGAVIRNYGAKGSVPTISVTAVIPESTWAYNQYKNDYNLHNASNAIYTSRANITRNTARNTAALKTAIAGMQAIGTTANQFSTINLARMAIGGIGGTIGGGANSAAAIAQAGMNVYETAQQAKIWDSGVDEISQDLTAISESYNAPAVGGVASSNIYLATGETGLSYGFKVPPLDIVKRADKFLTVYGYKQSVYRTINLHARNAWTYIKTVGLNASGNFPDDDMNAIKSAFNNGIFFWSYTATFGNFDQSNIIV